MTRTIKLQLMPLTLVAVAVLGCFQKQEFQRHRYRIDARRPQTDRIEPDGQILKLEPFSIDPAFSGTGVVNKLSENEYEKSFYEEYLSPPARMISEQTRRWMDDSGLFARVLPPASTIQPTHLLQGHISRLYADTANPGKAFQQLEISLYLVSGLGKNRQILFDKTYAVAGPMAAKTGPAYFEALEKGLAQILAQFEGDVAAALQAEEKKSQ